MLELTKEDNKYFLEVYADNNRGMLFSREISLEEYSRMKKYL